MADTSNSTPTPNENPNAFAPEAWLSQFESVGGIYMATDAQTCLCVAHQQTGTPAPAATHAMIRDLTDEQRMAVITYIRERAGFGDAAEEKPDLDPIYLEKLNEAPSIEPSTEGLSLNRKSKGSDGMDMTHTFELAAASSDKTEPSSDAAILAAWERWQLARVRYNAAPSADEVEPDDQTQADGMSSEEREYMAVVDAAEEAIQAAVAVTPAGAAIQLKIALYRCATKTSEEAALTKGDLDSLDRGDMDWTERLMLSALRSLERQSIHEPGGTQVGTSKPADNHGAYYAKLDEIDAGKARCKGNWGSQEALEKWFAWASPVWEEIASLPVTAANAQLKARAIWSIAGDDLEDVSEGQSTSSRLARQVITSLATEVAIETNIASAPRGSSSKWNAAMAKWQEAEAAYQCHCNMVHDPKMRQGTMDAVTGKENNRLGVIAVELREAVFDLPAPNRSALLWKMELLREQSDAFTVSASEWSNLMADVTRLVPVDRSAA